MRRTVASSLRLHPSAFFLGGCSSVGRASAFQAEGREFESRRPLQIKVAQIGNLRARDLNAETQVDNLRHYGPRSSGVERLLGKEEVMSSNLIAGSRQWLQNRER